MTRIPCLFNTSLYNNLLSGDGRGRKWTAVQLQSSWGSGTGLGKVQNPLLGASKDQVADYLATIT